MRNMIQLIARTNIRVAYDATPPPEPTCDIGEVFVSADAIGAIEALAPSSIEYQAGARSVVGLYGMGRPWFYFCDVAAGQLRDQLHGMGLA